MKKILYFILILFINLLISGCDYHLHSYEDTLSYDDKYHYYKANCGHNIVADKEIHQFNEGSIILKPKKTSNGIVKYMCNVCKYTKVSEIAYFQECKGDGSETNPYEIENIYNLYWFREYINNFDNSACGILLNDIIDNDNLLDENGAINIDNPNEWVPIGNINNCYSGIFDGNNHIISGLYLNDENMNYVGLFGKIYNGTIKNVKILDSYFCGRQFVGGIAGDNSGIIDNCINDSTIIGIFEGAGGIAGGNFGNISNSTNYGKIMGDSFLKLNEYVTNDEENNQIINTNALTIYSQAIGGICGGNYGTVESSSNRGTIIAGSNVGGITGWNNGLIKNSDNYAFIISNSKTSYAYAGGIAGYNTVLGNISHSINQGNILTTKHYIGGIVGYTEANSITKIEYSYNSGAISGKMYVGGIVGCNMVEVSNCYNVGMIIGNRNVGGIVGYNHGTKKQSSIVFNCYNTGNIKEIGNQSMDIGSIIGCNNNGIIKNCYYLEKTCSFSNNNQNMIEKSLNQFKSGEVTNVLNQFDEKKLWRQTLDVDLYPNFTGLKVIYDEQFGTYYNNYN